MIKIILIGSKIATVIYTLAWIILGFLTLFQVHVVSSKLFTIFLISSSLACITYLSVGYWQKDYGESEKDYRKRCKENNEFVD